MENNQNTITLTREGIVELVGIALRENGDRKRIMSFHEGCKVFGPVFRNAVADGHIRPVYAQKNYKGYSVLDIEAYMLSLHERASVKS